MPLAERTDPGPEPLRTQTAQPSSENELPRLLALAAEHEAMGQFDEAEGVLGRVLASVPDNPQALHLAGIVAFRRGRPAEAVEPIERAVALMPAMALFHRNLCELYRKLGRYDDALTAGCRAAELDPTDRHVWHNLSVLHYHRLELDAAIDCAERAIAL